MKPVHKMKSSGRSLLIGGGLSFVAVFYFTKKFTNNYILNSDYYKEAFDCLLKNSEAVEQLGEPITKGTFGALSKVCHQTDSGYYFNIPVEGSKASGTLYYWVTGKPSSPGNHEMYKAELAFEEPSLKKILIKDQPITEAEHV